MNRNCQQAAFLWHKPLSEQRNLRSCLFLSEMEPLSFFSCVSMTHFHPGFFCFFLFFRNSLFFWSCEETVFSFAPIVLPLFGVFLCSCYREWQNQGYCVAAISSGLELKVSLLYILVASISLVLAAGLGDMSFLLLLFLLFLFFQITMCFCRMCQFDGQWL